MAMKRVWALLLIIPLISGCFLLGKDCRTDADCPDSCQSETVIHDGACTRGSCWYQANPCENGLQCSAGKCITPQEKAAQELAEQERSIRERAERENLPPEESVVDDITPIAVIDQELPPEEPKPVDSLLQAYCDHALNTNVLEDTDERKLTVSAAGDCQRTTLEYLDENRIGDWSEKRYEECQSPASALSEELTTVTDTTDRENPFTTSKGNMCTQGLPLESLRDEIINDETQTGDILIAICANSLYDKKPYPVQYVLTDCEKVLPGSHCVSATQGKSATCQV